MARLVVNPSSRTPVQLPAALQRPPEIPVENRLTWSYLDLEQMTGLSRPTLRSLVLNHGFPHIRVGHRVLFLPEAVRDWFSEQVVRLPPGTKAVVDDDEEPEADD